MAMLNHSGEVDAVVASRRCPRADPTASLEGFASGNVIGLGIATVWRFWPRNRWAFPIVGVAPIAMVARGPLTESAVSSDPVPRE